VLRLPGEPNEVTFTQFKSFSVNWKKVATFVSTFLRFFNLHKKSRSRSRSCIQLLPEDRDDSATLDLLIEYILFPVNFFPGNHLSNPK
jgi:hypothetical protein